MKSRADFHNLVNAISYKDWVFYIGAFGEYSFYLQLKWKDEDHDNPGEVVSLGGRKWYLSPHMTDSEVILTAWAAVEMAELHEARELFLFEGERVLNPHIDVRELQNICRKEDVRV